MSEFIVNSNNVYVLLKENIDDFKCEAKIIDEAKCYLINYKDLDEFNYDGAYTYETGAGYCLVYNDLVINLETEDGMITDYSFK